MAKIGRKTSDIEAEISKLRSEECKERYDDSSLDSSSDDDYYGPSKKLRKLNNSFPAPPFTSAEKQGDKDAGDLTELNLSAAAVADTPHTSQSPMPEPTSLRPTEAASLQGSQWSGSSPAGSPKVDDRVPTSVCSAASFPLRGTHLPGSSTARSADVDSRSSPGLRNGRNHQSLSLRLGSTPRDEFQQPMHDEKTRRNSVVVRLEGAVGPCPVPASWRNGNACFWPPEELIEVLQELIEKRVQPGENWSTREIAHVYGSTDQCRECKQPRRRAAIAHRYDPAADPLSRLGQVQNFQEGFVLIGEVLQFIVDSMAEDRIRGAGNEGQPARAPQGHKRGLSPEDINDFREMFPIGSDENFTKLHNDLANSTYASKVQGLFFAAFGGSDRHSSLREMLAQSMSKDVAVLYSFSGRKKKVKSKKPFYRHRLWPILRDLVIFPDVEHKAKEAKDTTQRWLKEANKINYLICTSKNRALMKLDADDVNL
ncbi:hypothetical protein QAD02_013287 [Eretmocerus hayati]|uniref:Uncharacterized protein n=1 Tax=Eretmocerus hayati TaxID=131215 RepID=A0ACC2P1Q0_9HYME|nr:hypothetical protein QAD02_013287 [Eretmocerus hayati]